MKTRAPFVWHPDQKIDPMGFLALNRHARPRADGQNRWFLFRRSVDLGEGTGPARVRITVDGRYQAFLNGQRVGRGPIRCSPLFQRFDVLDLTPFLRPGRNTLAVLVHTYGVDTAWYETVKGLWSATFGDGALWVEGDGDGAAFDTGPAWRCVQSHAWDSDTARMNNGLGFIEALDANHLPADWTATDFDDSTWAGAQVLMAGGGGPEGFFGGMETRPFPTLIERAIPALAEWPEHPVRLVWARGLVPRPDLPVEQRSYAEALCPLPDGELEDTGALARGTGARITTAPGCDVALLLDFGRLITGYPRLTLDARGGEVVEIAVSEHLPGEWDEGGAAADARITPKPVLGLDAHVCRYVARQGRQTFERFEWSAIRWMQVTVRNAPHGVHLEEIGATATHYPVSDAGGFACSDPFLERLWHTGAYTLKLCMHDGWEDCPSREQRQWLGDATVEHLVGQAAFGPQIAPLNALYLRQVAESQRPDGLTQMFAPGDHARDGLLIPDWTLQWILNAGDHWMHTADLETIEAIFPAILRALAWFDRHLSPAGLVADMPYWHFMDWASVGRAGEACTLNAQLAGCHEVAAMLAQALDNAGDARRHTARAASLRAALEARHWDERRGVYVDCVDPRTGAQDLRVSQHANAAMVLWGGAPPERAARALARICDPSRLVFTPGPPITAHQADFDPEHDVVLANTFYAHFVYSALAEGGMLGRAIELMRDRLGPMIAKGSSTLWESLEPTASLCHGFSASPTWQLSTRVLGISPGAAGFARIRVRPDLAGLESAEGVVPTPHGPVSVRLDATAEGHRARIEAPAGIPLDVIAPPGFRLGPADPDRGVWVFERLQAAS